MIARIEARFRKVRRWLSRSEWAMRLLRLPGSIDSPVTPGLIMIQIDGLSHKQFTRALENGNLPLLKNLIENEHYRVHHLYSGLPSSTPAVQAELFYGVKTAVPAFSFLDRASREVRIMYEPASAASVEQDLAQLGSPLMKGGSVYCDIFTGGAAESHFCPASLGWGPVLRAANPFVLTFLLFTHGYSALRIAALLLLEFVLAGIDSIRGVVLGHHLRHELKFVAARVAICILLRELVTIGAKIDITRGLPIIHLNLLGYDEQAHRRGPQSRFAHWALKGIDDAIGRIVRAANCAARREYDVWIYSDHGQEHTESYENTFGIPVAEAITAVFQSFEHAEQRTHTDEIKSIQTQRVRLLGGGKRTKQLFPRTTNNEEKAKTDNTFGERLAAGSNDDDKEAGEQDPNPLRVVAMGPVGFIYYSSAVGETDFACIAQRLVADANLAIVLRKLADNTITAWTARGTFSLPKDADEVLGPEHPFLIEACTDLIALCQHRDAGDFVFCGWRYDGMPSTYPFENGSHAGPGSEETSAFALLPQDTVLPSRPQPYLRPESLRGAALHLLARETLADVAAARSVRAASGTLRLMTYNVHSCIGMDGKLSPERIARIITRYDVDVVCLQELDVGRTRTNGVDQAHTIARSLEMDFHFYPSVHLEEEQYGDAILTSLPMRLNKAQQLPSAASRFQLEPRGALWVTIDFNGRDIQLLNTHLGLLPSERAQQMDALVGEAWLNHPDCTGARILCGDFNATPSSPVCRKLDRHLSDAQVELENHRPRKTFFGRYPTARIDHVYISKEFQVRDTMVPRGNLVQVASDHLPLVVELTLAP
ncbi:MAG: endonuclease/exonuclease/phosphatase family metal-dependent hydrolase [Gammaproteobacteria bacterium]|jgi:endonuclease/exonuclease/phosphatase family metal-dependent hydrolase